MAKYTVVLLSIFSMMSFGQNIDVTYLNPKFGSEDPYKFLRFGDSQNYYAGFMWNNNNSYYGDGNDFSIFTYNDRDITLRPGLGNVIMFPQSGGRVGIGTTNPSSKLHITDSGRTAIRVGGPNTSSSAISDLVFIPSNGGKIGQANYWDWSFRTDYWANTPGDMVLYSHNGTSYTSPIIVQSDGDVSFVTGKGSGRNGNVGIGTLNPDSKLTVKGKIHAQEVKVDLNVPGPDYVFKENYELKSLEEVQNFIRTNGHLPNIPSAKEMEAQGIRLGSMNMKLLEKIEELTLYMIQQEKRLIEKDEKLKVMESRIENLEKIVLKLNR